MKIFVTGGSGYIGSAVIEALHGAGRQTLALARSRQSAARLAALGSRPSTGDIREPRAWIRQLDAIARRFDAPVPIAVPVEAVLARKGAWAACEAWDQTTAAPASLGWAPRHASIP